MSTKINACYKLAKKDKGFSINYNAMNPRARDQLHFSVFDSDTTKAIISGLYFGYLVGIRDQPTIDNLNNM